MEIVPLGNTQPNVLVFKLVLCRQLIVLYFGLHFNFSQQYQQINLLMQTQIFDILVNFVFVQLDEFISLKQLTSKVL